jgi:hypothetical protein
MREKFLIFILFESRNSFFSSVCGSSNSNEIYFFKFFETVRLRTNLGTTETDQIDKSKSS